jgi:hypothetical protein
MDWCTANIGIFVRDKVLYVRLVSSVHESTGESEGKDERISAVDKTGNRRIFFFTDADITLPIS